MNKRRPRITNKAIFYAVIVHALIGVLLFVSVQWFESAQPVAMKAESPVKATVVDDARVKAEMENIKREEQRRRNEELESQRRAEEARRQAEEAEKKRVAEEARLVELKRKKDEERKKAAEVEKKRTDEARRKVIAEEERKRALDQKRKEAEQALREQLEAEESEREAARASARAASEVAKYTALIQRKVESNWVRPTLSARNPSCLVRVRMVPGGEVLDVRVVRSSGNEAFDRSVENAVLRASPLPLPEDRQLFEQFRELEFTFKPKV